MGEDAEDEEEDEDVNNGGDVAASPTVTPPPPAPPAAALEEIDDEGPMEVIPEQDAPVPHEVILADAEHKMSQLRLYHALMRDTIRRTRPRWRVTLMIWMMTQMKAALTWMSGFLKMGVMIGIESSSVSLKFRFKNKFLGFA
jgi:hypothetical protein